MARLNLEKYFNGTDYKYYDSSFLISILEQILGKNLSEVKNDVNNLQVSVIAEQIIEFLEKTFQEEDPELKQRIEKPREIKPERDSDKLEFTPIKWTEQEIEEMSQEFADRIAVGRYQFEPYTLEYFNRYTAIVRNKALQLLNIIELIGTRQSSSIQELLVELDIQLDENGNITKEDIIRLITPTIQNISTLNEKVSKANDLSTYLTFKMSKHSIYRNGFSEGEVYPTKSILVKNLHSGYSYGNIPISSRQEQELHEEFRKSSKIVAKIFTRLDQKIKFIIQKDNLTVVFYFIKNYGILYIELIFISCSFRYKCSKQALVSHQIDRKLELLKF